ncbi:junctional adhesion molecule B [Hyperolius riggenbachi]|uniref:junctional adhesion molecule B n=1 Tax=Hyperolius riggenbachi TaxID=752182 RepID=UPI0035A28E5A
MSLPVFFLGYFVALCCQHSSAVIVESDNLNVQELEFGETILTCNYRTERPQEGIRLEWKKVALNGEVSFVYFKKELVGDLQTRAEMMLSSIRIKNLTRGDTGKYRCEVTAPRDSKNFHEAVITLTVLVAPSVPVCDIPSTAMSGSAVVLKCGEKEGNPASMYRWFKNDEPLDSQSPNAKSANATFKVDKDTGILHFTTVTKQDTGEYFCEASNNIGKPQRCSAKRMQVEDLNWAGIIAAVVVVAILIVLCGIGVCYAQRRGYFSGGKSSKKDSSQTSTLQKENDFKHTKSFVI